MEEKFNALSVDNLNDTFIMKETNEKKSENKFKDKKLNDSMTNFFRGSFNNKSSISDSFFDENLDLVDENGIKFP